MASTTFIRPLGRGISTSIALAIAGWGIGLYDYDATDFANPSLVSPQTARTFAALGDILHPLLWSAAVIGVVITAVRFALATTAVRPGPCQKDQPRAEQQAGTQQVPEPD